MGNLRNNRFIIASLALHTAAALLFFLTAPQAPQNLQVISIEYKNADFAGLTSGDKNKTSPGKGKLSGTANNGALAKLLPHYTLAPKGLQANGDTFGNNPNEDSAGTAWGSGSASFGRIKDYGLYRRIYDNVDGLLFYPSVLAYHKIEGVVNARLVINSEGSCDWVKTRINSTESHLRIYVLELLKKTCIHNYASYLGERKLTNVDFSFHFDISEHDDKDVKARQNLIVGNSLLFYRNSQQSAVEWNIGPFRGMFPIPLINIDFMWLQLNWEKHMQGLDRMKEFQEI